MSKIMIEKYLSGTIDVQNITFKYLNKPYSGAEFTISLPFLIQENKTDKN